jgi:hypothetical protein
MGPRGFLLGSIIVVCALIAATLISTPRQDIAVLDRLAPRIERAPTISPETRAAIQQLIDRARVSTGDPRNDMRRTVTIERVTDAIRTRDGGPELSGNVGQGPRPQ